MPVTIRLVIVIAGLAAGCASGVDTLTTPSAVDAVDAAMVRPDAATPMAAPTTTATASDSAPADNEAAPPVEDAGTPPTTTMAPVAVDAASEAGDAAHLRGILYTCTTPEGQTIGAVSLYGQNALVPDSGCTYVDPPAVVAVVATCVAPCGQGYPCTITISSAGAAPQILYGICGAPQNAN